MFFSFKEGFQYTMTLSLYFITAKYFDICFISKYLFGNVLESGVKVLLFFHCHFLTVCCDNDDGRNRTSLFVS